MKSTDINSNQPSTRSRDQPATIITKFFHDLGPKPLRILDAGCGTGKNTLFLSRLGHEVVAVDRSLAAIRDLAAIAKEEQLKINVEMVDIIAFIPVGMFDILLIDQSLLELEEYDRLLVFNRLIDHVEVGGWVIAADRKKNLNHFRQILTTHDARWMIDQLETGYIFASRME